MRDISAELVRALGVNVDPNQYVSKIVLTLVSGEHPRLDITRWVFDERTIGAVERTVTRTLGTHQE
jgi:hypothetical protein